MKLLAVVLLLLPLSGCLAEVVDDFTVDCPQFFITVNKRVTSPTVFNNPDRYKQICQTLNDEAEFATLYDTENKIPVYSAYRFEGLMDCKRLNEWHIEPQLDDLKNGGKNMKRVTDTIYIKLHPKPKQALNKDYKGSNFHKGHLAPVHQANSQSCADATFTLTNAAPQNPLFNSGKWKGTEKKMGKKLDTDCKAKNMKMYVVTGVVPGNNEMKNTGVRVPSHYWTAYCCFDNNNKAKHSGAYIGENTNDILVEEMHVEELEEKLKKLYHANNFIVFGNECYTNKKRKASPVTTDNPKRSKKNQNI